MMLQAGLSNFDMIEESLSVSLWKACVDPEYEIQSGLIKKGDFYLSIYFTPTI